MRKIITATVVAAVAVAGLASPAGAAKKPSVQQLSLKVNGMNTKTGFVVSDIQAKIARSDHKNPKGVKVCLQKRGVKAPGKPAELGCAKADKTGLVTFNDHEVLKVSKEFRTYHPETKDLRKSFGAWVLFD